MLVRLFEHQGSDEKQAGAIAAIAPKIGCIPQTLREWVKQAEKDSGMRDGMSKVLLLESLDLLRAGDFRPGGAMRPVEEDIRCACKHGRILERVYEKVWCAGVSLSAT